MKNGKVKQNRGVLAWILLFFLLLYSIILVGLLIWAIFVSLKTPTMWDDDKVGMPVGAPWDWQRKRSADSGYHSPSVPKTQYSVPPAFPREKPRERVRDVRQT